jgi:hypothetical protein
MGSPNHFGRPNIRPMSKQSDDWTFLKSATNAFIVSIKSSLEYMN